MDECRGSNTLCDNGGMCANLEGGYICNCPSGYAGHDCSDGTWLIEI